MKRCGIKYALSTMLLLQSALCANEIVITNGKTQYLSGPDAYNIYRVEAGGILVIQQNGYTSQITVENGGMLHFKGRDVNEVDLTLEKDSILRTSNNSSYEGVLNLKEVIFSPTLGEGHSFTVNGWVDASESALKPLLKTNNGVVVDGTYLIFSASEFTKFGQVLGIPGAYAYEQVENDEGLMLVVTRRKAYYEGVVVAANPAFETLGITLDNIAKTSSQYTAIDNLLFVLLNAHDVPAAVAQLVNPAGASINIAAQAVLTQQSQAMKNSIAKMGSKGTTVLPLQATSSLTPLQYYAQTSLHVGSDAQYDYTPASADTVYFFATPFGTRATQKNKNGFQGYKLNSAGLSLGLIKKNDEISYGIATNYNAQTLKVNDSSAKSSTNQIGLSLFASKRVENFLIDLIVGYSHAWNDSKRDVIIGAYASNHNAKYGSNFYFASTMASYTHTFENGLQMSPSIGLDYLHVKSDGYSESGGSSALKFDSSKFDTIELPISLKFEKEFEKLTPHVEFTYVRSLGKKYSSTSSSFVAFPEAGKFITQSAPLESNKGKVTLGVQFAANEKLELGVNYSYGFASKYQEHNLLGNIKYRW